MKYEQAVKAISQLEAKNIQGELISWSPPSGYHTYYDVQVGDERFSGVREFNAWLKEQAEKRAPVVEQVPAVTAEQVAFQAKVQAYDAKWAERNAQYRAEKEARDLEAYEKRVAFLASQKSAEMVERPKDVKTVEFEMGGKQYQTVSSWSFLD